MKTVKILALAIVLLALAGCAGLPSVTVAFNTPADVTAAGGAGESLQNRIKEQLRSSTSGFAAIMKVLVPTATVAPAAEASNVVVYSQNSCILKSTKAPSSEFAKSISVERLSQASCTTMAVKGPAPKAHSASQNLY